MDKLKFWLAINIYHEARGEDLDGQIAIGHVCLNRALKRHKTVQQVILRPWQFSWHNGDRYPAIEEYEALLVCLNVPDKVIYERMEGKNLFGADHYHADWMDEFPSWAKSMKQVAHVGKHIFYRS